MVIPRVLHINDCAFTTTNLMRAAGARALPWRYLPLAVTEPAWTGWRRPLRRAVRGAAWEVRLAREAAVADLLHVHFATVYRHTGWVPRPYVLHLHGSDIRNLQYDARYRNLIHRAVRRARSVLYSTPDLAEHILPLRPDARLLPVPVDTDALPPWRPAERPRVLFASRWEQVKGLDHQLEIARGLRAAAPEVELLGLDWGNGAPLAAEAGVRLAPRMAHAGFLELLATAHVVIGQPTGMLAASELEAVGIGVPTVSALNPSFYLPPDRVVPVPPVLLGTAGPRDPAAVVDATLRALDDPAATSTALNGSDWLRAHHDASVAVEDLVDLYSELDGRGR